MSKPLTRNRIICLVVLLAVLIGVTPTSAQPALSDQFLNQQREIDQRIREDLAADKQPG